MPWTDDDYRLALALRGGDPPMGYPQIAARLSAPRSGEAVRQKLISERCNAERGGARSRTDWREALLAPPRLGEGAFLRKLMAGGGHSRFSEVTRNAGSALAYHALTLPLVGPDGMPRPCGKPACRCLASSKSRPCKGPAAGLARRMNHGGFQ